MWRRGMARERLYRNNAERQAAYRARHADQQPVQQAVLASLGRELHGRFRQAVEAGSNGLPAALLGPRADDTLINLIRYATRGRLPGEREGPRQPFDRWAAPAPGSRRNRAGEP